MIKEIVVTIAASFMVVGFMLLTSFGDAWVCHVGRTNRLKNGFAELLLGDDEHQHSGSGGKSRFECPDVSNLDFWLSGMNKTGLCLRYNLIRVQITKSLKLFFVSYMLIHYCSMFMYILLQDS